MKLLAHERMITHSKVGWTAVILTNLRVIKETRSPLGRAHTIALPLEQLDSVEASFHSYPGLLAAGIAMFGLGFYLDTGRIDGATALMGIGAVLVALYVLTRKRGIHMHTARSTIFLEASKSSLDAFMDNLLQAWHIRVEYLHRGPEAARTASGEHPATETEQERKIRASDEAIMATLVGQEAAE